MSLSWVILDRLRQDYGDSYYLFDSKKFEKNYDDFLNAFRNIYNKTFIGYSYKTNYTPKLCSLIDKKGGYAEIVSEMEYDLAIKIGIDPRRIIVNGPYKTEEMLYRSLLAGSIVNLDSFYEVDIVENIANQNPYNILEIGIRCNFEVDNKQISRFGFDVKDSNFREILKRLRAIPNINIKGIHCHYPSRDIDSFLMRTNKILIIAGDLFKKPPEYIDIGGGFFGKMEESLRRQFHCKVPKYEEYAQIIASKFEEYYKNCEDTKKPRLFLEPGSALVADTMRFVVKVLDVKNVRDRKIAMTTGSKLNMGQLSSSINLPITVFSKFDEVTVCIKPETVDIAGYTCIENDYLYKGYKGNLSRDDYIVFDNVGSYSVVFKPPFILPNVPIIEHRGGEDGFKIIKRAETFDDIFKTFIF